MPTSQQNKTESAAALKNPVENRRLADAARLDGDYAAAIKAYRRAIDNGGDGFDTRMGLGSALAGAGDTTGAAAEFRTAEAMAPTRPEPMLGLGRLDLVQNKPSLALGEFDAALKVSPSAVAGWNGKGYALDMMERHQEAQDAYRAGLALDPDDHVLENNYGLSLALSGNYGAAVTVLTKLVQEPGATARNRQNLALALGLQGDSKDAALIAETDLSKSQVDANLAFYSTVRRAPIPTQSAAIASPVAALPPAVSGGNPIAAPAPATSEAVTSVSLPSPEAEAHSAAPSSAPAPASDAANSSAPTSPPADPATPVQSDKPAGTAPPAPAQ